jgi:hypothetical protein
MQKGVHCPSLHQETTYTNTYTPGIQTAYHSPNPPPFASTLPGADDAYQGRYKRRRIPCADEFMDNNHLSSDPAGRKISKLNAVHEDDYSSSVRKKLSGSSRTGQACDRCKVCVLPLSPSSDPHPFRPVRAGAVCLTLAHSAHPYDN